jgi:hypothetical protein
MRQLIRPLANDRRKKNAAKAAFFSIYPDHPGAKAHLDYCR